MKKTFKQICAEAQISRRALYNRIAIYEAEHGEIKKEYNSEMNRVFDDDVAAALVADRKRGRPWK